MTDYMTDEELAERLAELEAERERRRAEEEKQEEILRLSRRVDDLLIEIQLMRGVQAGDEWVQPSGAHDAYPDGAVVTFEGELWESETSVNLWRPGRSGWKKCEESND